MSSSKDVVQRLENWGIDDAGSEELYALLADAAREIRRQRSVINGKTFVTGDETTARKAEYFDIFPTIGCNQCPWERGDIHERDCDFPNCSPAWMPPEEPAAPDKVQANPVMEKRT